MKSFKKVLSLFLCTLTVLTFSATAFAAESTSANDKITSSVTVNDTESKQDETEETKKEETEKTTQVESSSNDFTHEKAESIALTAAKSKLTLSGLPSETVSNIRITKISYSKKTGSYKAVIRSGFKHKYTCTISKRDVFGKTIGFLEKSEYTEQNVVAGFFGFIFEKTAFFFIKLFGMRG